MALAVNAPAQSTGQSASRVNWLLALLVAALWFIPINQLRVEWSINPQYAYGWAVPFLACYLFAERWKTRPQPRPGGSGWLLATLTALLALSLLPMRLVEEAAPDWRLVSWALAGAVVALSLCAIAFAGGRPWLRHFIFPVCFFLVAVPWPIPFEQAVVQKLMRCVASLCVEALGWGGIPAVQQGNVIQISSGSVGVEEACSGVRSLQTTLMIALFLGELFRFSLWRRLTLLGAGLALAFACNVGRALLLVYLFANMGSEELERYHDKVGLGVLGLSLVGLGVLAFLLRPAAEPPRQAADAAFQGRSFSRRALLLLLAWLAFVEVGTETWYRIHDSSGKAIAWTIDFPAGEPAYHEMPIAELTRAILLCNQARAAEWTDAGGNQWSMFFLRWFPGRASVQLARSHGPEICLPASGMTQLADLGVAPWHIGDVTLDAHSYLFGVPGRVLYVFYCLAEDRQPGEADPASTAQLMTWASRLEGVWAGRRNRGQQVLELVVTGPPDAGAAQAATARMLSEIIRPAFRPAGT